MKFSRDRMAKLAGIPTARRSLNESRRRSLLRRRLLSESKDDEELSALFGSLGIEPPRKKGKRKEPTPATELERLQNTRYASMDPEAALADFMSDEYMPDADFDDSIEYDPYRSETMASFDDEADLMTDMPSLTPMLHSDPYMDYYHDEEEESFFDDSDDEDLLDEAEEKDDPGKVGPMPPTSRPPSRTPKAPESKTAEEKFMEKYEKAKKDENALVSGIHKTKQDAEKEIKKELSKKGIKANIITRSMGSGENAKHYSMADIINEMIEINERDLVREVRNIRRKRINEARLKAIIEDELRDILSEMRYKRKFK